MSEMEAIRVLRGMDRPAAPPLGLAAQIWSVVESALTGSPSLTRGIQMGSRRRWRGPLAATAAAVGVLAVGITTWALLTPRDQAPLAPTTTVPVTTTVALQPPPDVVVGTPEDGFADVLTAVDDAQARWQPAEDFRYAYRVTVVCECPDSGTRWVRRFGIPGDGEPWDVNPIFTRIRRAITDEPTRVEAAFSATDGYTTYFSVRWPEASTDNDMTVGVDGFHEITFSPSDYDGRYRFKGGVVDGQEFGSPVTGVIYLALDSGFATFPVDCNVGGAMIDIQENAFGAAEVGTTDIGCPQYSTEASLFVTAMDRATTISGDGSSLTLTGPGVELRFVAPQPVDSLGALPLTAAGETVLLEFPDGRSRGVVYTIESAGREPGEMVWYVLTAGAEGVDSEAGWEEWSGEFDVPDVEMSGPGPDRILVPETIQVGDYRLCSPYWEPDPYCFDLLVRPAGAPWFVTAGPDGVLLHDADGTSSVVSESPAAIAFYVGGRVVVQTTTGGLVIVEGEQSLEVPLQPGEILLDVALVDGRTLALVSDRSSSTTVLDLDNGNRLDIGPSAIEARIQETTALLRLSDTSLEARSLDGGLLWEATIDAETMVMPGDPGVVRLDRFGELFTESDPAFRQYLETRLIDIGTGEELDSFEYELAIPLEGDQITDRCRRAELRDGLMLCPQPDGRLVTLQVEGGDMIDFPAGRDGIGTFARGDG
jgi:hypothetical protein